MRMTFTRDARLFKFTFFAVLAALLSVGAALAESNSGLTAALKTIPSPPLTGQETNIRVTLRDSKGIAPQLEVGHERLAHFLLVSKDLEEFHHVHAEDFGADPARLLQTGEFDLKVVFGRGGPWQLAADVMLGGKAVVLTKYFEVSGEAQKGTAWNFDGKRKAGGLNFALSPIKLKVGEKAVFSLAITQNGQPAKLSPYLGAAAHVALFAGNGGAPSHLHGESAGSAGHHAHGMGEITQPLTFSHTFDKPGNYRLWIQVKHADQVVTVPFDVAAQ